MKIAYILPSLVNTGPIVVVNNVIKHLKYKVDLIDVYYFNETRETLNFDCNVIHITKSDVIDFDKYDVIHSHTLWADVYVYKNRKKIKKAKIISTIHQDTFMSFTIQFNRFASFFLGNIWCYIQRHFNSVIAISDQLKNQYSKIFPNIKTIYNGCNINDNENVDEVIAKAILSYKEKGYRILGTYAYISKRKGISQVIEVLEQLPDYIYVIFGEGPYLNTLKSEVVKYKVKERVLFLPYVKAPYSYLKFIDIYMMPSYSEGFGLAMVEAALANKSIVCSNIPSFHEIFSENEVSFFELDNKKSLLQAINQAYSEKVEKSKNASLRANKFFTSEIMAENHFAHYEEIVNKK
ncbi:glycosyltransferase family 4 protein [Flavobacterium sp. HBTb2-11-1]|uniref:glycosyltransferase family 4 protein n=1 Tax=Flavobacterium sp. HBTb2-11-1 TaxID=2692212 RepID=UPI0013707E81|nr:glycosyltransferase family 4 protein [Flavobacterium sp. HBTb2-11-1]MXO06002.1 glycosyltransferase [Flavobacterium sp. HBTb2-11-1]